MKKSIRSTKKPMLPKMEAQAKELYNAYSGKSEAELMNALRDMSAEERSQLAAFEQELSPLLSDAQRNKLNAIIRSLTI